MPYVDGPADNWEVSDVRGHGIDSGHFIPEEQPDQVYAALKDFFGV